MNTRNAERRQNHHNIMMTNKSRLLWKTRLLIVVFTNLYWEAVKWYFQFTQCGRDVWCPVSHTMCVYDVPLVTQCVICKDLLGWGVGKLSLWLAVSMCVMMRLGWLTMADFSPFIVYCTPRVRVHCDEEQWHLIRSRSKWLFPPFFCC